MPLELFWQMQSSTLMMNMAPIFLGSSLQLGTYANSTALRAALLHRCYSIRNFGANLTASSGNGTSAVDDRMQVDSLKKGKRKGKGMNQHQRGNRTTSTTNTSSTDINTCKNCGTDGQWAKDCWKPGGGACDTSTYRNTGKGKSKHTGKGKGKHVDVVETEEPRPSETASTASFARPKCYWRTLVHLKRGPVDHGCDNQFRIIHKETSWCRVFAWQWRPASRLSDHVSRTKDTVA